MNIGLSANSPPNLLSAS